MIIDKKRIKKILVLRYRSIGDIILSYPALESLRLTFPHARIDYLVDEPFRDICKGYGIVNNIILHRRDFSGVGFFKKRWEELKFANKLRKQKYDLVVDLHCGPRSATLALLTFARYRLGQVHRLRNKLCYNIYAPPGKKPHTVEGVLNILAPLKPVVPSPKRLHLTYEKDELEFVEKFLQKLGIEHDDLLVTIHPGARVDYKRLPAEKMGQLVSWIGKETGAKVVLAGADSDIHAIGQIATAAKEKCRVITNLDLGQLAALIGRSGLFIGNDSGPMHMAAAVGTPIVAFFGPSDPAKWSPWGAKGSIVRCKPMDCMPCDQKHCHQLPNNCMQKIDMQDAKRAVIDVLERVKENRPLPEVD